MRLFGLWKIIQQLFRYTPKAPHIQQKYFTDNNILLVKTEANIGTDYRGIGEYSNALVVYQRALEIKQKCLPSRYPGIVSSYLNIAIKFDFQGTT